MKSFACGADRRRRREKLEILVCLIENFNVLKEKNFRFNFADSFQRNFFELMEGICKNFAHSLICKAAVFNSNSQNFLRIPLVHKMLSEMVISKEKQKK